MTPLARQLEVTSLMPIQAIVAYVKTTSWRFFAIGLLLALAVMAAVAATIWQERRNTVRSAEHTIQILGVALTEHANRLFQSVDLVLRQTQDELQSMNADRATSWSSRQFHYSLTAHLTNLPQAASISIFNARGDLINSSRFWPMPALNVSDRDYFRHFQSQSDRDTYIGLPAQGRATGQWAVYLSQRLNDGSGRFEGIVVAEVTLQYLETFYKAIATNDGSRVTLLRQDGVILAKYPPGGRAKVGENVADPRWNAMVLHGGGLFYSTGTSENPPRLVSLHLLHDYPLVLRTSVSKTEMLRDWRRQSWTIALVGLAFLVVVWILLWMLVRQFRLLERRTTRLIQTTQILRRKEHELRYAAHHDKLTKTANRALFEQELGRLAGNGPGNQQSFALLYLDLDRFKTINDTRGHLVGDKLLMAVADRMRECTRETDLVARLGGDEFAILQEGASQPASAAALGERLMMALGRPYEIDGEHLSVSTSIGIALFPLNGSTPTALLQNADTALYRAKGSGRSTLCFFEASMDVVQQERFLVEHDLRAALDLGQLHVAYQPIYDMRTRSVVAIEALLRWNHPIRGSVSPAIFIPIAEASGLIVILGRWVLETATAAAAAWPESIAIAVNLSPLQFRQPALVETILSILARTRLPADRLELEVTENILLDEDDSVLHMMRALQRTGIRITLDDFGTGHSGLSYLRRFPFDRLKIDQSFVRELGKTDDTDAIVEAILQLSDRLGLHVVAEGVETQHQVQLLCRLGCHLLQGYHLSRPVLAEEVVTLLEKAL